MSGRNEPCPCGSGRKYKHCCLNRTPPFTGDGGPPPGFDDEEDGPIEFLGPPEGDGPMAEIMRRFLEEHPGRVFESMDEVRDALSDFIQGTNRGPDPDFEGLSPEQMHGLMYRPFDIPEEIVFAESIPEDSTAPVITLLDAIAAEIAAGELKATGTGALPRDFSQDIALRLTSEHDIDHPLSPDKINREGDAERLHQLRIALETAGILRTYRGRFIIATKHRKAVASGVGAAVYPAILRGFATRYNWGYMDGYAELPRIQQFFGYTLYLLAKYGDLPRPTDFYADAFVRAFPMMVDEVDAGERAFRTAEDHVRSAYKTRTIHRFLVPLGLVEVEEIRNEKGRFTGHTVRALPLLGDVVRFPKWL